MIWIPLISLLAPVFALGSSMPPELKTFLGKPPANYEKNFLQPAKQLEKALEHLAAGKKEQAIKELTKLSESGEMAEHASFELAQALREKKDFTKSTALANRILYEYPNTPHRDAYGELIIENDCDFGLVEAERAKGPLVRAKAKDLLFRCLQRTAWRNWKDREPQVDALYGILKAGKDPLLGPFISEITQALPASSAVRAKIQKEVPATELNEYATAARFRSKTSGGSGVKPMYPDVELFNGAMEQVLAAKWKDANAMFKQLVAEYPQSEHLDRAQYWIARSEETLGNEQEAKRRYEEIFRDSPLSYYGLQSALKLKRDLSLHLIPTEVKPEPIKGTLLPGQALSLWRLRALMEAGLVEQSRVEARALFQNRPGGFTFGQENPEGAALAALLYHHAGYSLAAFSHAFAAISLQPEQLNAFTLDLIFPSHFQKEFEAASETTGVHPLLLFSVAKQESAFIPNAVSRANALGLMQLLLSTARDLDSKLIRQNLFEPARNTELGSRYLQRLLNRFEGNIALALAGYNAGPSRAVQWQKRMLETELMKKSFDVDVFIDTIPFTETRRYVAAILRNYAWYKLIHKDGSVDTVEELAFQWQKNPSEQPRMPSATPDPQKP